MKRVLARQPWRVICQKRAMAFAHHIFAGEPDVPQLPVLKITERLARFM